MSQQAIPLMSDEQFLKDVTDDLLDLRAEFLNLVEDHDIYWQVQGLIQSNARLMTARSCFFDMMNDSFSYWAAIRVRRIVDADHRTISLRRLLSDLVSRPTIFDGKTTGDEVRKDILKLEEETKKIKSYVDQYVAHHDRKPTADIPHNNELTHAIEMLESMFHKYYGILRVTDIDLHTSHLEDPLAIFDYAWRGKTEPPISDLDCSSLLP
jgi:AbiU2